MDAGIRFVSAPLLTGDFTLDRMNTTRATFESVVASHDEHDCANAGSRRCLICGGLFLTSIQVRWSGSSSGLARDGRSYSWIQRPASAPFSSNGMRAIAWETWINTIATRSCTCSRAPSCRMAAHRAPVHTSTTEQAHAIRLRRQTDALSSKSSLGNEPDRGDLRRSNWRGFATCRDALRRRCPIRALQRPIASLAPHGRVFTAEREGRSPRYDVRAEARRRVQSAQRVHTPAASNLQVPESVTWPSSLY